MIHDLDGKPIMTTINYRQHVPSGNPLPSSKPGMDMLDDIIRESVKANNFSKDLQPALKKVEYVTDEDKLLRGAMRALYDPNMGKHYPNLGDAANASAPKLMPATSVKGVAKNAPHNKSGVPVAVAAIAAAGISGVAAYKLSQGNKKANSRV